MRRPPSSGLGPPRLRLASLTGVLALALLVSALLAWQAVASDRAQRRAAEQSLGDYADFAAFVLATNVYREYGIRVLAQFGGLPPWNSPALFTRPPMDLGCGERGFYFEYEPATGALRTPESALAPAAFARLTDTLTHVRELMNEASWRFRYVRLELGDGGSGVFFVSTRLPGGFGIRGMSSCLWQDSVFVRQMKGKGALPPSLTGGVSPDSLYSIAVAAGDGGGGHTTLLAPAEPFGGTLMGSAPLGPEFGDLALQVTLNPDRAPGLLIGGMPSARNGLALGLFALSAALLVIALVQLRREVRLVDARSDFVSNVSHELRTPLSQILIFTELLKLERLRSEPERKRALDIVDKETRRLIRLVENVLQFARSPSPPPLHLETVALAPLVRDTVEAFRPLAEAQQTTVEVAVGDGLEVLGERNALRQVVVNLLDNAVKYGPPGQTVRLDAVRDNGMIELHVDDQGPGVPADARERIWLGFARLETTVAGSGIGLSVVRSLVDRMHGSAWVTDASTGGARFVVSLPVAGEAE